MCADAAGAAWGSSRQGSVYAEFIVEIADTIKGFKELCDGKYDDIPEAAFYMVGTIEEAKEKAKKMAKEVA